MVIQHAGPFRIGQKKPGYKEDYVEEKKPPKLPKYGHVHDDPTSPPAYPCPPCPMPKPMPLPEEDEQYKPLPSEETID
jgi:hypothetical protein